jgi:hypothetical protein
MWVNKKTLAAAVANLERALGEDGGRAGRVWAARVDQALFGIEQALHRHDATLEPRDGAVVDVESGQAPSPGLDRRIARLHEELAGCLAEAGALRARVRKVLEGPAPDGLGPGTFDAFRRRAGALLDALGRYEREEAHVILETTTTDIGAGD